MRASAGSRALAPSGGEEEWRGYLDGCPAGSQNRHTFPVHTNEGPGSRLINGRPPVCFPVLTPAPRPTGSPKVLQGSQTHAVGSRWAGCRGPKASHLLTGRLSAAHHCPGLLPGLNPPVSPGPNWLDPGSQPVSWKWEGPSLPSTQDELRQRCPRVGQPALPPQHMRRVWIAGSGLLGPPSSGGWTSHLGGAPQAEPAPLSPDVWETGSEAGAWPCGLGART